MMLVNETHPYPSKVISSEPSTFNILLLEDDVEQSKLLADQIFKYNAGYDKYMTPPHRYDKEDHFIIFRAYTFDEAVAIANTIKIDIFILDIYLSPVKNSKTFKFGSGLDFAKSLQNKIEEKQFLSGSNYLFKFNYTKSPIIFLTSEKNPEKQVEVHQTAMMVMYVTKPCSIEALYEKINHAMRFLRRKDVHMQLRSEDGTKTRRLHFDSFIFAMYEDMKLKVFCQKRFSQVSWKLPTVKVVMEKNYDWIHDYRGYTINPQYISGYDDETNEVIMRFIDGIEEEYKLEFKWKEIRIPVVGEREQALLKLIAERVVA